MFYSKRSLFETTINQTVHIKPSNIQYKSLFPNASKYLKS